MSKNTSNAKTFRASLEACTIASDCEFFTFTLADYSERADKRFASLASQIAIDNDVKLVRVKNAKATKNNHQIVNVNRVQSNTCVMFDLSRFLSTSNAYAFEKSDLAKIEVSSEAYAHYRKFALLSHVVFEYLKRMNDDATISALDLYSEASALVETASRYYSDTIFSRSVAREKCVTLYAINDTLRDLEHFAFVYASENVNASRRVNVRYKINRAMFNLAKNDTTSAHYDTVRASLAS